VDEVANTTTKSTPTAMPTQEYDISQYGSAKLDNLGDVDSMCVPHGRRKLLANKGLGTSRAITFDLEIHFKKTYSR